MRSKKKGLKISTFLMSLVMVLGLMTSFVSAGSKPGVSDHPDRVQEPVSTIAGSIWGEKEVEEPTQVASPYSAARAPQDATTTVIAKPEVDANTQAQALKQGTDAMVSTALAPEKSSGIFGVKPAIPTADGIEFYAGTGAWYKFYEDSPWDYITVSSAPAVIYAGEYVFEEEMVYAAVSDGKTFIKSPFGNLSSYTVVGTTPNVIVDMAYNYATGTMYALAGTSRALYTIDLDTAAMTYVGSLPGTADSLMTIAISTDGTEAYGVEITGEGGSANLYAIDLDTSYCTLLGGTGYPLNYIQTMAYDHNTGRWFWAQYTDSTDGNLIEIDVESVLCTNLGQTGDEYRSLFVIPESISSEPVVVEEAVVNIQAPETLKMMQLTVAGGKGYKADLVWEPADTKAQPETVYTAYVTLTAKTNASFAPGFTVDVPGQTVNNLAVTEEMVTFNVVFPMTEDIPAWMFGDAKIYFMCDPTALGYDVGWALLLDSTCTAYDIFESTGSINLISNFDHWVPEDFPDYFPDSLVYGVDSTTVPAGYYDVFTFAKGAIQGIGGSVGYYPFEGDKSYIVYTTDSLDIYISEGELESYVTYASAKPSLLPNIGGKSKVSFEGLFLDPAYEVGIFLNGNLVTDAWASGLMTAKDGTKHSVTVIFPDNEATGDMVYDVKIRFGQDKPWEAISATVTVVDYFFENTVVEFITGGEYGFYGFTEEETNAVKLGNSPYFTYAADYVADEDAIFACVEDQDYTGNDYFVRVNPYDLNDYTIIKQLSGFINEMAYDYSSGTMYCAMNNELWTIDLDTAAMTKVGSFSGLGSGLVIGLAITTDGEAYALETNTDGNSLWSVNLDTGACTRIGYTGFQANYAQSMTYDHNSDRLFWAQYYTNPAHLVELDMATGAGVDKGIINAGLAYNEFCGLMVIPNNIVVEPTIISEIEMEIQAPETRKNMQLKVAGGKGYVATLDWDPADTKAEPETVYTAYVMLTAKKNASFAPGFTVTVPGQTVTNLYVTDEYVTFEVVFPETEPWVEGDATIYFMCDPTALGYPVGWALLMDSTCTAYNKFEETDGISVPNDFDYFIPEDFAANYPNSLVYGADFTTVPSGYYDVFTFARGAIQGIGDSIASYLFEANKSYIVYTTDNLDIFIYEGSLESYVAGASAKPVTLSKEGGKSKITYEGLLLGHEFEVGIFLNGEYVTDAWAQGLKTVKNQAKHEITIIFPANETPGNNVYDVKIRFGQDKPWESAFATVTVVDYEIPVTSATVTLTVPGDPWGDGSGFGLMLDETAEAYGSSSINKGDYQYFIPEELEWSWPHVLDDSVSIEVPAGIYDAFSGNVWNNNFYSGYRHFFDDLEFKAGYEYVFTWVTSSNCTLTIIEPQVLDVAPSVTANVNYPVDHVNIPFALGTGNLAATDVKEIWLKGTTPAGTASIMGNYSIELDRNADYYISDNNIVVVNDFVMEWAHYYNILDLKLEVTFNDAAGTVGYSTIHIDYNDAPVLVKFDSFGGTTTVPSALINRGRTVAMPEDPEREGYSLVGWLTADDVMWNFSDPVMNDMILYAKWAKDEAPSTAGEVIYVPGQDVRIPFTYGSGKLAATEIDEVWFSIYVDPRPSIILGIHRIELDEGYNYWIVGNDIYISEAFILEKAYEYGALQLAITVVFNDENITSSTTLVKIYEENAPVKVFFDARGGNNSATAYVSRGLTVGAPNEPVREGYYFIMWATVDGEAWLFNTPVYGDLTLYAMWGTPAQSGVKDVPVDNGKASEPSGENVDEKPAQPVETGIINNGRR